MPPNKARHRLEERKLKSFGEIFELKPSANAMPKVQVLNHAGFFTASRAAMKPAYAFKRHGGRQPNGLIGKTFPNPDMTPCECLHYHDDEPEPKFARANDRLANEFSVTCCGAQKQ